MRFPGGWELLAILVIVMVVFGASRLPEIGSSLGRGMRNFKQAVTGDEATGKKDEKTGKKGKKGKTVVEKEEDQHSLIG